MHEEIIISGFGGQGALFAGQLLSYAALDAGKHVTWIPSYGPEMRGGTANCTVIVSDEPIGSPLIRRPTAVIALNHPSFDKYESLVKPGGVLVYDISLIPAVPAGGDIRYVAVPANTMAEELGSMRQANVALLGALVVVTGILSLDVVARALEHHLPERARRYLASNIQVLRKGGETAASAIRQASPLIALPRTT